MEDNKLFATIHLGTSQLIGLIGEKNDRGKINILAHESEPVTEGMTRGCISNPRALANSISRMVLKLQNRMNGAKIERLYVGVGGQSVQTIANSEFERLGGIVTSDALSSLKTKCNKPGPVGFDVLETLEPEYYLDGAYCDSPEGAPCDVLEARYKQVIGRPSIRQNVKNIIEGTLKLGLQKIFVSPLALADVVLTEIDKKDGCALIDFGASTTSILVYQRGDVEMLKVIPLGSDHITRDLKTILGVSSSEAERLKLTYGQASGSEQIDLNQFVRVTSVGAAGVGQVQLKQIVKIVESRMTEIIENVRHWIEVSGASSNLNAGIVITGGGASLKELNYTLEKRFKMPVHHARIVIELINERLPFINVSDYAVAIGLLNKATENSILLPKKEVEPEPVKNEELESVKIEDTISTIKEEVKVENKQVSNTRIEGEGTSKKQTSEKGNRMGGLFSKLEEFFTEEH